MAATHIESIATLSESRLPEPFVETLTATDFAPTRNDAADSPLKDAGRTIETVW